MTEELDEEDERESGDEMYTPREEARLDGRCGDGGGAGGDCDGRASHQRLQRGGG